MKMTISRLVLCIHEDQAHGLITHWSTLKRCSCRIVISVSAQKKKFEIFILNIIQSYAQARTLIQRRIFALPTAQIDVGPNMVLEVVFPLNR